MIKNVEDIRIEDFDYHLPENRIARFPKPERDSAKLLVYQQGELSHDQFRHLPSVLPAKTMLVVNNTRVIHARLYFLTPTGARIEILCLEPIFPKEYQLNFSSTQHVRWKALIGNNKRWKHGNLTLQIPMDTHTVQLEAERIGRLDDAFEVCFSWSHQGYSFGEILAAAGIIPLPPYLNRKATNDDTLRYQTVYAQWEGSVAAPTAGLHFTDSVFSTLAQRGIVCKPVTLHVGAGTFMPVKSVTIGEHHMHQETIVVEQTFLAALRAHKASNAPVIPVGTTSARTLESLYWFGYALIKGTIPASGEMKLSQWVPYEAQGDLPSAAESIAAIEDMLRRTNQSQFTGQTQLMIAPGYAFQMIDGLITNFHQPKSTLLLLIAALIGDDWKRVYHYAMENEFRFLSFGDSSLLFPPE